MHVDEWWELTFAVPSPGVTAANNAPLTASLTTPTGMVSGALWYEPKSNNLSLWNGSTWVRIGQQVVRSVRFVDGIGSWSSGGLRQQAVEATKVPAGEAPARGDGELHMLLRNAQERVFPFSLNTGSSPSFVAATRRSKRPVGE